jgi:hypothetical protein
MVVVFRMVHVPTENLLSKKKKDGLWLQKSFEAQDRELFRLGAYGTRSILDGRRLMVRVGPRNFLAQCRIKGAKFGRCRQIFTTQEKNPQ